jgi:hypothetical protein
VETVTEMIHPAHKHPVAAEVEGESDTMNAPVGAELEDVDPTTLTDINFDDRMYPFDNSGIIP